MTRVTILCNNPRHPVYPWLENWVAEQAQRPDIHIELVQRLEQLTAGDLLFLVSCSLLVSPQHRQGYGHSLVLHASALPEGRGWSPHIWQILEGRDQLTISLLEAAEPVDTGAIWRQIDIQLDGTELYDEINERLFKAELELMTWAVDHYREALPVSQEGEGGYYRQRTPADSELDPDKSLAELMPLLRVSDPHRFPAFFYYRGRKYTLHLEKVDPE